MRSRFPLLGALVLVVALVSGASAPTPRAYGQPRDGATLTVLRGQVAVIRADGSAVQPAPSGTIVQAGDELRTLTRTGALITFFAGTEIEMGEDTILLVERVSAEGGKIDISLKQVLGVTLNRVQSLTDPTSVYRIEAGGAAAVVRGTTFLLIGPVTTSQGNISALVCLDDCDGRTTFAGCAVMPYTAFGVTVERSRVTSGCETAAVDRGADYFNAGFEAITTFEQTFASAGDVSSPGIANLGRDDGQRRADEREAREQREDRSVTVLSPCQPHGATPPRPSGPPQLFRIGGTVSEGNSGTVNLNYQVFLLPPSSETVTVQYATGGGTATPGVDYTPVSGTLTFPPGTSVQTVTIPVIGDTVEEPTESLHLILSNPSGATVSIWSGSGLIVDDDGPLQLFLLADAAFEGNTGTNGLPFTVLLSRTTSSPITVNYATVPGGTATSGVDFTPTAGTLTIPAGQASATFSVPVIGDTAVEPDETVQAQISGASAGTIVIPTSIGTILDDDGTPTVAVFDRGVTEGCEGTTDAQIIVQLSRPVGTGVVVTYTTSNGTATAGADFEAASGTVTFTPGQTTQTIRVPIIGDADAEPNETFTVILTGATGAAISDPQATVTILNDD